MSMNNLTDHKEFAMATLTKKQLKQQVFQDLDAYEDLGASFISRSAAIKELLEDHPSVFEEKCSKWANKMTNKALAKQLDRIVWDDDPFHRFFGDKCDQTPYDDLCTIGLIDEWRSTYEE